MTFTIDAHAPYSSQFSILSPGSDILQWCDQAGEKRWKGSYKNELLERGYDTVDSKRLLNVKGVIGEMLFCEAYGFPPKEKIRVESVPDGGYDISAWGKRHQVRLTRSSWGGLIVRNFDKAGYDFATCIEWEDGRAVMLGYVKRDEIQDLKVPMQDQWFIPRSSLHPWEWLPFHCQYGDEWLVWWTKVVNKRGLDRSNVRQQKFLAYVGNIDVLPVGSQLRDPEKLAKFMGFLKER